MYSKHRQKDAELSVATYGFVLVLVLVLIGSGDSSGQAAEPLRWRTVTAQWTSHGQSRRDSLTSPKEKYPPRGEILLSSTSSDHLQLVLQVHHNHDLLGQDFTETFYTSDGQPVTVRNQNHTDHCFYQGHVKGHPESWLTLSTCSGLRGLISLNSTDTFYLEPLEGGDPLHHSLMSAEELSLKGGTCGHHHDTQTSHLSTIITSLHSRVKRSNWGTTKYLELYIVADNTLFRRQNRDYEKTKTRIMEIANYVDKFYRALNIRVPLIGLEVWTDRDACIISEEPNATLWSFLQWRQKLKSRKRHDNAQLLTRH